jgi:Flp pilus assembly protein TadG
VAVPTQVRPADALATSTAARPATGRRRPDAGSATVELTAAIPLLVAVTLAMVSLLGLARDQVLAQGAAREAAREAAIGGDPARASAAARAALPPGRPARIIITAPTPDRVRVSVGLPVDLPFGVQPVVVRATAVAAREPGPPPTPTDR